MTNVVDYVKVTARGIPALARIDTLIVVPPWKGSAQTCDNDMDYYGYTELEFTICDQREREAPWISDKMTQAQFDDVEQQVMDHLGRLDA